MALGDPQPELQTVANAPGQAPAGAGTSPRIPEPPPADEVKLPDQRWSDALASSIVIHDFQRAQEFRSKNKDHRWDENERLYNANVPQRYWDGTDVPRSSLGVKLIWKQERSLLPRWAKGLTQSSDGIFFEAFPLPGTRPQQAIAVRELLAHQLNEAGFRLVLTEALQSAGEHGTGIVKLSWKREKKRREVWMDLLVPENIEVFGMPVTVGERRVFKREKITEFVNAPQLTYISLRDFYIDPSHKHPWIDIEGLACPKYVIQRAFLTLDQLLELKEHDKSYKGLPSREALIEHAHRKLGPVRAEADSHKQAAAWEQGTHQSFPQVGSSDPAKYPFEVLEYWTKDRLVTVVDRMNPPARNIPNPYGFIPFFAMNYADVLDDFYGKGLAEVLEGEQRFQQGIINARADELSLNIHGQLVYNEAMVIGKHQLRPRPGGAIGVTGDVRQAVTRLERQPMTNDAHVEVMSSEQRSEQYTGLSGMVTQGSPSVPTSATRTKFGIGTMVAAASDRIEHLVERATDTAIIPMLHRLHALNSRFLDPETPVRILGSMAQEIEIDPLAVTNGQFEFEMRASSRMAAKAAMQQSFPFLLQTILNPGLMQALAGEGIVPNVEAIIRDIMEVNGWRNRSDWFRRLSPEEMQARHEQEMTPEKMKLEKEQLRMAAKGEQMGQQQSADILKMVLEKALDQAPGAASLALAGALDEVQQ